MDANGQWRAHDADAPMHTIQTLHQQVRVTIPALGPLALPRPNVHQGRNTRTGRKVGPNLARGEGALSVTQTYTWRTTTPYAVACYLPDASTRTHTGAERDADQASIASCAARRLAPTRKAQCPEHITPAPSYNRSSPPHTTNKHTQPLTPPPPHASPRMHPTRTQARPNPTQAARSHDPGHTLLVHTHTGSPRPHTLHKDPMKMFICSKHGQTGSGHTGFRLDGGEKTRGVTIRAPIRWFTRHGVHKM